MSAASRQPARGWGIAILVGLGVAAALILIPRVAVFEPEARDECERIGERYVGLASESGRWADPVPDGARCVADEDPAVIEIEVDFFADTEPLNSGLGWLYRLVCVVTPLGVGAWLGWRLSRP